MFYVDRGEEITSEIRKEIDQSQRYSVSQTKDKYVRYGFSVFKNKNF